VFSGDHEFVSSENPFPSFPYIQFIGQMIPPSRPGDEYPMGALDQVLEIQDMFNTRENQMTDALDHTAMGGFGLARRGAVDIEEFEGRPRRIYAADGTVQDALQWFNPPSIPGEAIVNGDRIRGMADDVLNIHGIVGSGDTKDIRSGQGVSELVELANRVLITQSYSLESCLSSLVRYQIHMFGSPFCQRGTHYSDHVDLAGVSPDAFDISITAGLNLPVSRQVSDQKLFRMRELEALDNEALIDNAVDTYELPDKEIVKARMRAKEEAAQQMANERAQAEVAAKNSQAYRNVVPINQGGA
jgi:hypothetical protein